MRSASIRACALSSVNALMEMRSLLVIAQHVCLTIAAFHAQQTNVLHTYIRAKDVGEHFKNILMESDQNCNKIIGVVHIYEY